MDDRWTVYDQADRSDEHPIGRPSVFHAFPDALSAVKAALAAGGDPRVWGPKSATEEQRYAFVQLGMVPQFPD